jgi:hypothetical protein
MTETAVPPPEPVFRPDRTSRSWLVVPVIVLAAGVILWIVLPNGGPIVLGAGAGLLAVFSARLHDWLASTGRRLRDRLRPLSRISEPITEPIESLVLTARPLILPLLAALTVGTFELAWPLQILAGCLFVLIAWFVVIHPEERSVELMLGAADREIDSWSTRLRKHSVWLVALLFLAVPAWLATRSAITYFETIGGFAAFLLVAAMVMWIAALLLRLAGDATSYLRIALAFVLSVGLLRGAMAVGVVPGDHAVKDALSWLPTAVIWVAIALIVLDVALHAADFWLLGHLRGWPRTALNALIGVSVKRWRGGPPAPAAAPLRASPSQVDHDRRPTQVRLDTLRIVREFGLTAAVGATVVLLGSAVYGLAATAQPGQSLGKPGVLAGTRPVPAVTGGDRALADAYSPVLALTSDERWSPIRVDGYLEHARLTGASHPVGSTSQLPASCPRAGQHNCYQLTIDCPAGSDACGHSEIGPSSNLRARSTQIHVPPEGATYVRVLHKDRPPTDRSPNPFGRVSSTDRGLAGLNTLIQYWYFYYYDEWVAPAFAGDLIQRHESDWEAVTVGLAGARPLFVAYSEHCAGTWVRWPQAEVSNDPTMAGGTHPLVAVARGSHANYPEADQQRSPDWTHCQGLPAGLTTLVSYASNIRDKTEYTWLWHEPEQGLILADAKTQPMLYPGSWGAHDETILYNFNANQISVNGTGPLSPPLQALWQLPLKKIYCNYSHPADFVVPAGCTSG